MRHNSPVATILFAVTVVPVLLFTLPAASQTATDETKDGGPAAPAEAIPKPQDPAKLYESGLEAFNNREWHKAASLFEQALGLDPNPSLAYNVGRSYEYTGNLEKARAAYLQALEYDPDSELRQLVYDTLERLDNVRKAVTPEAPTVGLLEIRTTPPGAKLSVNGVPVGVTPFQAAHPAGTFKLRLEKEGYATHHRTVGLEVGKEVVVDTALQPSGRLWTWISFGTSAALLGGGIYFGLQADDTLAEVRRAESKRLSPSAYQDLKDQGAAESVTSAFLYGAAGLSAAAGIALFFAEAPSEENTPQVSVGPTGVVLQGTFQ